MKGSTSASKMGKLHCTVDVSTNPMEGKVLEMVTKLDAVTEGSWSRWWSRWWKTIYRRAKYPRKTLDPHAGVFNVTPLRTLAETVVVDCGIPLLLSQSFSEAAECQLNFVADQIIIIFGEKSVFRINFGWALLYPANTSRFEFGKRTGKSHHLFADIVSITDLVSNISREMKKATSPTINSSGFFKVKTANKSSGNNFDQTNDEIKLLCSMSTL